MLENLHFIRPQWLFAIPVIVILLLLQLKKIKHSSGWENICDAELLEFQLAQHASNDNGLKHQNNLTRPSKKRSFNSLYLLIPLLFLVCIIALAGPSWEKKPQPVFQQGKALVILLDLSLSMNATDIKPSRLERAKLKLIDILKDKKEGQTALIAFAGDAHTVSPLTIDNKTIMSLLPPLDSAIMPLSGSNLIDALNTAKQLLKNAGFARGDILLLSDGIDANEYIALKTILKTNYKQGYRFSIIGIGSQAGSPIPLSAQGGFVKDQSGQVVLSKLEAKPLIKLTSSGGGQYHKLSLDNSDFEALIGSSSDNDINQNILNEQEDKVEQWLDTGGFISLLLIPLALLSFRKSVLGLFIFIVAAPLLIPQPAHASWKQYLDPSQLWQTADQQGQKEFNGQRFDKAAEHFSDKNWKASALYKAGKFEQALEQFAQADDADSLYNKGNTLANLQQFEQAKEAYTQALKKQPDMANAQNNLDYINKILEQQKQQQQESNKDQQDSDKDSKEQQQDQKKQSNESDSKDSNSPSENTENSDNSNSSDSSNSDSEQSQSDDKNEQKESDEAEQQASEAKSPEDYQQQSEQSESPDSSTAKPDHSDEKAQQQEDINRSNGIIY